MDTTHDQSFSRFAGACALTAGLSALIYSLAFIVIARTSPDLGQTLYSLFQLIGGLAAVGALVGLYHALKDRGQGFAHLALLLGLVASAGSIIHGGYDLANAINPPTSEPLAQANLPSQVDPRGLLTFGIAGLSVGIFSWLMSLDGRFPRGLALLGYLLSVLLVIVYLARLIILDATNISVVVPALLAGFLVNPAWYIWLGLRLRRLST